MFNSGGSGSPTEPQPAASSTPNQAVTSNRIGERIGGNRGTWNARFRGAAAAYRM
jgi:hypothetical protein